jgi:phosphohistidine swiveling domain-containing protein
VFLAHEAEEMVKANKNEKLILVRHETSPEDVGGMWAAQGILTSTGGMTSHAAVVARGWGKCCIAGAGTLQIDYEAGTVSCGQTVLKEGDWISLNGSPASSTSGRFRPSPARSSAAVADGNKEAEASDLQDVQAGLGLGRPVPQDEGPHQRRHAQGRGIAPRSAPKASVSAAPNTCSSKASASGPSASSFSPPTRPAREKALAKLLPYQRSRLRRHLRGHERPARHDPPAGSAAA